MQQKKTIAQSPVYTITADHEMTMISLTNSMSPKTIHDRFKIKCTSSRIGIHVQGREKTVHNEANQ